MTPRQLALAPLGRWRTQLFWRLFGLTLVNSPLFDGVYRSRELAAEQPLGLHAMFAAGALLMLAGARGVTLLAAAITTVWALGPICFGDSAPDNSLQLADEFVVFMALPVMAVLLTGVVGLARRSVPDNERLDAAHVALLRISLVVAMAFAALHKLNADFFDPKVSCALSLAHQLTRDWPLPWPDFLVNPTPTLVLLGEGSIPVLLLLYPRLGILATFGVVGVIGHVGAVAFTLCVVSLAFAFFDDDDRDALAAGLRAYALVFVPLFAVFVRVTYPFYAGSRPWTGFGALQFVCGSGLFALAVLAVAAWRRGPRPAWLRPRRPLAALRVCDRRVAAVLIAYAAVSIANGLSPYLGLKYRLSYAMLSNLRADDERWNSWIFPRWLHVPAHDAFVHVERVEIPYADKRRLRRAVGPAHWLEHRLVPGPTAPWSFEKRLALHFEQRVPVKLDVTWRGVARTIEGPDDPGLRAWLDALPDDRLFQAHLTRDRPQRCVH